MHSRVAPETSKLTGPAHYRIIRLPYIRCNFMLSDPVKIGLTGSARILVPTLMYRSPWIQRGISDPIFERLCTLQQPKKFKTSTLLIFIFIFSFHFLFFAFFLFILDLLAFLNKRKLCTSKVRYITSITWKDYLNIISGIFLPNNHTLWSHHVYKNWLYITPTLCIIIFIL